MPQEFLKRTGDDGDKEIYWEVHEIELQLGSQELKSLRAGGMRAIYTQVTAHVSYESEEEGKHISGHSLIVHDSMGTLGTYICTLLVV